MEVVDTDVTRLDQLRNLRVSVFPVHINDAGRLSLLFRTGRRKDTITVAASNKLEADDGCYRPIATYSAVNLCGGFVVLLLFVPLFYWFRLNTNFLRTAALLS